MIHKDGFSREKVLIELSNECWPCEVWFTKSGQEGLNLDNALRNFPAVFTVNNEVEFLNRDYL